MLKKITLLLIIIISIGVVIGCDSQPPEPPNATIIDAISVKEDLHTEKVKGIVENTGGYGLIRMDFYIAKSEEDVKVYEWETYIYEGGNIVKTVPTGEKEKCLSKIITYSYNIDQGKYFKTDEYTF